MALRSFGLTGWNPAPAGAGRAVLAVALLPAVLFACAAGSVPRDDTQDVSLAGRRFHLELALEPDTRYKGLSGRSEIDADGGMLFVFPEPEVLEFVMRECVVPIDIIFVNAAGRIVRMHEMKVEPPERRLDGPHLTRYSSGWPAQFAIELKGGTLAGLKLKPGDRVELPRDDLKKRAG